MKSSLVFIAAIFLIGCGHPGSLPATGIDMSVSHDGSVGEPPPSTTADRDGTRLRIMHVRVTSDDGLRQTSPVGFFDEQLKIWCQPQYDKAGVLRCLPNLPYVSNSYFADRNCTIKAAVRPACWQYPDSQYIKDNNAPVYTCSAYAYTYYRLGSAVPTAYVMLSGACVVQPTNPGDTVYSFGFPEPDESFAAVTQRWY